MNTSPDTEPNNQPGSDGHVSSAKAMALRWHNEPAGDFARRLGVSAKTIVRWSSTERRIRLDTADRIAEAIDSHPLLIWGTEYANAVSATDPTESSNRSTTSAPPTPPNAAESPPPQCNAGAPTAPAHPPHSKPPATTSPTTRTPKQPYPGVNVAPMDKSNR